MCVWTAITAVLALGNNFPLPVIQKTIFHVLMIAIIITKSPQQQKRQQQQQQHFYFIMCNRQTWLTSSNSYTKAKSNTHLQYDYTAAINCAFRTSFHFLSSFLLNKPNSTYINLNWAISSLLLSSLKRLSAFLPLFFAFFFCYNMLCLVLLSSPTPANAHTLTLTPTRT